MKPFLFLLFNILILFVSQSCNTLYNTRVINIEVVEPAKVMIPQEFKRIAVKYNNINVSPNPHQKEALFLEKWVPDEQNTDSIASEIYFGYFVDELQKQGFFDTVIELEAQNYSKVNIIDTNTYELAYDFDSIVSDERLMQKVNVAKFSKEIHEYPNNEKPNCAEKHLHPILGLYQPAELQTIKNETNANLLISLDYFSSVDAIRYSSETSMASEIVLNQACWNFYNLDQQTFYTSYNRKDTVFWAEQISDNQKVNNFLPPRKDAVLNAADISGSKFAHFLIPHWIEVQRMYYSSGHVELVKTKELIEAGKWMEAAKIWKEQANNKNKSIAAKSKFNMGLACEMQGNLDAALEWVVESFHVFGQENKLHFKNCTDYIRILSLRKRDIKIIENQFSVNN